MTDMDFGDVNDTEAVDADAVRLHQLTLRRQELLDRLHVRERTLGRDLQQLKQASRSVDDVDDVGMPRRPAARLSLAPTGSLPRLYDLQRRPHTDPVTHEPLSPLTSPKNSRRRPSTNPRLTPVTEAAHRRRSIANHLTTAAGTSGATLAADDVYISPPQYAFFNAAAAPLPGFPAPPQRTCSDTKQDVMEMLMLQNAQMHQLVMQQMTLSALPSHQQQQQAPSQPPPDPAIRPSVAELRQLLAVAAAGSEKRPAAVTTVHYHHHNQLPPISPVALPPIQVVVPSSSSPSQPTSHASSPIHTVARRKSQSLKSQLPAPPQPVFVYAGKLPFPGPVPLRRFRHAGYVVAFFKILQIHLQQPGKKPLMMPINEDFVFSIRLKEAIAALHRIYLNQQKKIYVLLVQCCSDSGPQLTAALSGTGNAAAASRDKALDQLAVIVENIVFELTEIMPPTGVLGTNRKSTVYKLIQPGVQFPDGYLWQVEKSLLSLDAQTGRTSYVPDNAALVLLTGLFVGRAFVTSLLMNPAEYGLSKNIGVKGEQNLRLLSTVFIYALRQVYTKLQQRVAGSLVAAPVEVGQQLFNDTLMQPVYSRLAKSLDYAQQLLFGWGSEYIKRLRTIR